ncbi:MAG: 2-hydroxyacid dehydrogenase, partial [Sphingobacteriales bacterium]
VSCSVIANLAALGVKFIITRSAGTDHIDFNAASKHLIQVKSLPNYSPYAVAEHTLTLALALNRHLIEAANNAKEYNFSLDKLTGFNLHGKTVGIIGLGHIGIVTGRIFHGFGCRVVAYDIDSSVQDTQIGRVELDELLRISDIISLHIPLNEKTRHMINAERIDQMKTGVMLINTSRGAIVNTPDILTALDAGKIGYYGADVYEFEKRLFFEDHEADDVRDAMLSKLMVHRNVIITPHQAFLTIEALTDIARQTIRELDIWEKELTLKAVSA